MSAIFHVSKIPVRDGTGETIGSRVNARNATKRRRMEKLEEDWEQKAHNELGSRVQERTIELRRLDALLEAERQAMKIQLEFLREQMEASAEFVSTIDNIDPPIRKAIASLGKFSGADRVCLFMFNDDDRTMDNTHEWCARGVPPKLNGLKNCPIPASIPRMDRLRNGAVISIPDVSEIPPEARVELETLQGQHTRSAIVLPVNPAGELCGFMVLSSSSAITRSTDEWDSESIQLLRTASDTISAALERMQTEKELHDTREAQAYARGKLEIVDTILHNVGNAINSVTIGIGTIQRNLENSILTRRLLSLASAIKEHEGNFSDYVKNDPQGQKVAPFVIALADDFAKHDRELTKTVSRVCERAKHIADIIRTEKIFSRRSVYRKDIDLINSEFRK